jgi:1-phosphatidylinositol phosphodiesterase
MNTAKAILDNPSTAPPLPTPRPVTTQNWMSALPGNIKISRLTIPGTHESCARGIGWPSGVFVNCQDLSLVDQLNAGIRYLDIRCRHISDIFAIHHEAYYLGINFGSGVRDVCVNFLQANPSETILMEIKREYDDAGNNLTFQQVFDNYVKGLENFFYLQDHIPTLEEARGKIVVICRFTVDSGADTQTHGIWANPWQDNSTFTVTNTASNNETVNLTIQDHYDWTNVFNDNIDAKYSDIWNTLQQAQADATDRLFINFTSASSSDGVLSPQNFVYGINPRLYNDLAEFGPSWSNRLGVLAMNFVNDGGPPNPFPSADEVIQRIISFNDKLKTNFKATESQLVEEVA